MSLEWMRARALEQVAQERERARKLDTKFAFEMSCPPTKVWLARPTIDYRVAFPPVSWSNVSLSSRALPSSPDARAAAMAPERLLNRRG